MKDSVFYRTGILAHMCTLNSMVFVLELQRPHKVTYRNDGEKFTRFHHWVKNYMNSMNSYKRKNIFQRYDPILSDKLSIQANKGTLIEISSTSEDNTNWIQ